MRNTDYLASNSTLPNVFDTLIYRHKHPDTGFRPNGLTCFCGTQGSGKTLSCVLYIHKLMQMYPSCVCVSNVELLYPDIDKERLYPYEGMKQLTDFRNGIDGVIFFLDEIQLEFNSLESKQLNTPVFELVAQQRKQRVHIVGTTQVFARLAKPFREQFREVVLCSNFAGLYFRQQVYRAENVAYEDDVRTELTPLYTRGYFTRPAYWSYYDTYKTVERLRRDFK